MSSARRRRGLLEVIVVLVGAGTECVYVVPCCVLCTSEKVCIRRLQALRGPPQQLLVQAPDPVVPVLVVQPTEEETVVAHLE